MCLAQMELPSGHINSECKPLFTFANHGLVTVVMWKPVNNLNSMDFKLREFETTLIYTQSLDWSEVLDVILKIDKVSYYNYY